MEVFLELLLCVCASSSLSIALAFPRRPGPDKQYSNSKRALVRLRARAHVCICRPAGTPTQYHHHCTRDHPLVVAVSKKTAGSPVKGVKHLESLDPVPSTVLYKHTKIQEACESHSRNLTGEVVQDQGV